MGITVDLVYGTTAPQVFQALVNDAANDYTAHTVAMVVRDRYNRPVTVTGTVTWTDVTIGTWQYTPDGQLTDVLSPYQVRAQITDSVGDVLFTPNHEDTDTWYIRNL